MGKRMLVRPESGEEGGTGRRGVGRGRWQWGGGDCKGAMGRGRWEGSSREGSKRDGKRVALGRGTM